jgi:hypothetical protein
MTRMGLRDRTAIRAFRDDDLPGVARVWRELRPDAMHSERGLRHLIDSFPAWCFAHRWAAEHRVDRVVTDNDERNAPMLAINRRLGYEPFAVRRGFVKGLRA